LPFQNMTNDTTWNVWQDGIKDELINYMTNFKELRVSQSELITTLIHGKGLTSYDLITPSVASEVSEKLDANVFVTGSIKQADNSIRINAQITDSKTEVPLKSFQVEGQIEEKYIFNTIDSLKELITNFLVLSELRKDLPPDIKSWSLTNSPEAYRYYFEAMNLFGQFDYSGAIKLLNKAVDIDTNFVYATLLIAQAYSNRYLYDQAKEWFMKVYRKREQFHGLEKVWIDYYQAYWYKTPNDVIKYLRQAMEFDDQSPTTYWLIGDQYYKLLQFDKAIPEFEKSLEAWEKYGVKPFWTPSYTALGFCYHKTGKYRKEKMLYMKAERDFPDNSSIILRQTILALTVKDEKGANKYLEKYLSLRKEQSASEIQIAESLGNIYFQANLMDKAEEFYRKALSLSPNNAYYINNLAYFLIDNDRNVKEGTELIDQALAKYPNNHNYLHTKGWGLYKQEKYKEALEILQKSWNLRPTTIFSMQVYYHLETAKKAVDNQKQNN
jgi:tetratricopeptide (TPR) repeat protein